MISARIIKDSITDGGDRVTTFILKHPRPVHPDFMTHRDLSRNASSSRAIPTHKARELAIKTPFIPYKWGANQKGMQAYTEVSEDKKELAKDWWKKGFEFALAHHKEGEELGLHKQLVNRYLEPYMYIEVIATATNYANFYWLRDHYMAEPHMQVLAKLATEEYLTNMPTYLAPGKWHLPFIDDEDLVLSEEDQIKVSTGRCARISFLTHEGKRDHADDIRLHNDLVSREIPTDPKLIWEMDPIHASPAEHPCLAMGDRKKYANFRGWKQYRKFLPFEAGPRLDDNCLLCGVWEGNHVTTCPNKNK